MRFRRESSCCLVAVYPRVGVGCVFGMAPIIPPGGIPEPLLCGSIPRMGVWTRKERFIQGPTAPRALRDRVGRQPDQCRAALPEPAREIRVLSGRARL